MSKARGTTMNFLKQAAADHQSKLAVKVRARLNGKEAKIFEWLFVQYKDDSKKRWYDPYHILFSTNFALDLVEKQLELSRLIVTGIMLHDIGYFAIQDKTQWSSPDSRITHMQEGVALAARVLCENGFNASEIEEVLGMIGVHDNPYIGIEIKGKDRLAMRDCDRIWVMHLLSFYKDLASKPERYQHPRKFLQDRMVQFYGKEHPFGDEWAVTVKKIKKNALRIEIPTHSFTKDYVARQFKFRTQELRDHNVLRDVGRFSEYLYDQIEQE